MYSNGRMQSKDFDTGIITLVGNFNYGNRLQAYATYRIYEKLGKNPVQLDLKKRFVLFDEVKKSIKKLLHLKSNNPEDMMTLERRKAFLRFDSLMRTQQVDSTDDAFLNKLDYISVGSDQVWNPLFIKHYEDWFAASFAQKSQKVALAASIGIDQLDSKQKRWIDATVKSFSRVSIREKRGAELIKECSGLDVDVVCDPTVVLPADEWRQIADDRCTPSDPYVFTYLLGGLGVEASEVLDEVTDHGRIPVVSLSDRQHPDECDAGPAEFIDLIDHASHVVTDSFHAAVFSSILQSPLTIVHREGSINMFSRLEQLSELIGIEDKVYGSPEFKLSSAGNYDGVASAIDLERDRFINFLKGFLHD